MLPDEIVMRNLRKVTDLEVVPQVPQDRPETFIRVDMGAPQRINLIQYRTLIVVQVYAPDDTTAIETLLHLQGHLEVMDMQDPLVSGWDEETGPVPFPDPDIPHVARWQMTGVLHNTTE